MNRIMYAVMLCQGGDREGARRHFSELWQEIGSDGDPFHRCTVAHYMADVQDDACEELTWDLRALEAANLLTDERLNQYHADLSIRAFYPSLHLNLATSYFKLRQFKEAREHLCTAQNLTSALPEGEYSQGVRKAINRIANQLSEAYQP